MLHITVSDLAAHLCLVLEMSVRRKHVHSEPGAVRAAEQDALTIGARPGSEPGMFAGAGLRHELGVVAAGEVDPEVVAGSEAIADLLQIDLDPPRF